MKFKKTRFFLHIEYLLLLISLFTFTSSLYIGYQSSLHFEKLNDCLQNLQIQFRQLSLEDRKYIADKLEQDYFSITYFNKDLSDSLNDLINVFTKNEETLETYENFLKTSISFSNCISQYKNKLDFGYLSLILTSFILIFLTLFLFFYKGILAKNELVKIKNTNEEHLKFSRDLHDGAAQDIAALRLYLEQGDNEKSKQFADQAFKEIRYLIDSLHLDLSKNFRTTVEEMLNAFQTNYKIETQFLYLSEKLGNLPQETQIQLFRILQEALSNTARHSGATKLLVKIIDTPGGINFTISDNGCGIENSLSEKERNHYGLENIKERVKTFNGSVEFITDGGTIIAITIKNTVR